MLARLKSDTRPSARVVLASVRRQEVASWLIELKTSAGALAVAFWGSRLVQTFLRFEDHPQFFGNWRVHFIHMHQNYEVIGDNREGWLSLWHRPVEGQGVKLSEVEANKLGESGQLDMLRTWLSSMPKK